MSDCRPDRFEIDADLSAVCDRVQDESSRVGDIEAEMRPSKRWGKSGFPVGTVSEFQPTRVHRQVSPKDGPKPPATGHEAVTVCPKSEPLRSCLFARVEGLAQGFER